MTNPWLVFLFSAILTVLAASKLADYGDVIGIRTKLGGMFVGTLLLATATSLPEMLTAINAIDQHVIDLTVGDISGSSMVNMLILAIIDLIHLDQRILRQVALTHSVSAGLACLLMAMAALFALAQLPWQIGRMGVDSLLLIGMYVFGMWFLDQSRSTMLHRSFVRAPDHEQNNDHLPPLWAALIGFGAAILALVLVTPWMVRSATAIAEITGLGSGIVGALLVALVTSLPEVVTTYSAIRRGAFDMAAGNLFGSNIFNMFTLGLIDAFYRDGRLMAAISPDMVIAVLLGLILTSLGGLGNVARVERRILVFELDASMIVIAYVGGMALLISRQIG